MRRPSLYSLMAIFWLVIGVATVGHAEGKWAMSLYGGVHASDTLDDMLSMNASYSDGNQLVVVALSREVYAYQDYLTLELEGQLGHHFGPQVNHFEAVALGMGRWLLFPWDEWVDTSLGLGFGFSYYTDISYIEASRADKGQHLLVYLGLELAFSLPQVPEWALITRVHHRSGMWSVVGKGVSNYAAAGLRYTF